MEPTWQYTETENGSPVEIKTIIRGISTAWTFPTRYSYYFIKLNPKDLEIINNLGLPNWYFHQDGKGLTLEKGKQDWGITTKHFEALNLKTPYRNIE